MDRRDDQSAHEIQADLSDIERDLTLRQLLLLHLFLCFTREYLLMDRRDDQSAHEIQADLSDIERDLTLW